MNSRIGRLQLRDAAFPNRSILPESTLSFFGVGVRPPPASWGSMLYQARST